MPLNDAKLTELARDYEQYKKRSAALDKKASAAKAKIIKELERRGTRAIEHDGVRTTMVVNERVVYDDGLLPALSPRQRKLVTKEVLDSSAVLVAIETGTIDVAIVEDHSRIVPSAPYIRVSEVSE